MSVIANALAEKDAYESRLTQYVNKLRERSDKSKLQELAEMRNMPVEVFTEAGVFFIGEMAEMILPSFLSEIKTFGVISNTNDKPIFKNRWVFPINTVQGNVQNLVGYSNMANERYIYGTAKYYRRTDTLYGLENLNHAYELGWAVLTEGITDTVRLRSMGIKNSFANCGTHASDVSLSQLNRLRHGVIKIPDRDGAGFKANKKWNTIRSITLNPYVAYKDIDEMLRDKEHPENIEQFNYYFGECVRILLSMEHIGKAMPCMDVTML